MLTEHQSDIPHLALSGRIYFFHFCSEKEVKLALSKIIIELHTQTVFIVQIRKEDPMLDPSPSDITEKKSFACALVSYVLDIKSHCMDDGGSRCLTIPILSYAL